MGGGGNRTPSHTSQQITQNQLDPAMVPYFHNMMSRAEALSSRPYVTYGGPRISSFTAPQQEAFGAVGGLGDLYQGTLDEAQSATSSVINQSPSQYTSSQFDPSMVSAGQMGPAGVFDTAAANQYMNPYLENVLNTQFSRAQERFGEQNNALRQRAARSGGFGGYRQGVTEAIAQRDFNRGVNEMEASGLYQAYQNAQDQFERDRQARFGVERTNIENTLRADLANQGMGLSAYEANERARQQQEVLRQGGLGQVLQASEQLGSQGLSAFDAERQRIEMLRDVGLQQQQQQQASLDLAYGDFGAQQNWDMNQLNFLNSILRGTPITTDTTVSNYNNPNTYSQMLGLGLNGLALANMLGGSPTSGGTG